MYNLLGQFPPTRSLTCECLPQVLRESRGTDSDYRKLEEMHHRCLAAERLKDDLQLSLKRAENRIKQLEVK
jgi:hypothetical protein